MDIREASAKDIPDVARVHAESWRTAYRGIVPEEYLATADAVDWEEHWSGLKDPASKTQVFVAESKESGIVGIASAGPERTGDEVYVGELYALYLLRDFQRQGIGKRLTVATAQRLGKTGIPSMLVWMFRDNAPARRFYEALGAEYLREQEITLAGGPRMLVAYGWQYISALAAM